MGLTLRLATLLLLSGCAVFKVYDQPRLIPLDVKVRSLNWREVELAVVLQVSNPNTFGVELGSFDCEVFVEGEPSLFRVEPARYEFPPKSETVVEIPVFVPYRSVVSALKNVLSRDSFRYKVAGTAGIGVLRYPFEFSGEYRLRPTARLPAADAAPTPPPEPPLEPAGSTPWPVPHPLPE